MTRAQTRLWLPKWSPSCNKCEAVRNVELSYCSVRTCGQSMLMMSKTCLKQTCCTIFSADYSILPCAEACCCSCSNQHCIAGLGIRCHIFYSVLHDKERDSRSQSLSQTGIQFLFHDSTFCCMTACTVVFRQHITLAVTTLFR